MSKALDRLFIWLLKRELDKTDQWARWKIKSSGFWWYLDVSMKDDGHHYREVR